MKILIVDDQELVLLSLSKCLSDLGYDVICARDVNNALLKYEETKPNLVITDLYAPMVIKTDSTDKVPTFFANSTRLEIVKYVKTFKNDNIPIIVLYGNTDKDILLKCFELGADEFIRKPLHLGEISRRVHKLVRITEEEKSGKHGTVYLNV